MKLVYCIAGTYRPAGMERVLADKANWLARQGHKVTIVTTDQLGRANAFPLDPAIDQVDLGINYEENNGGSLIDKIVRYPFKQCRHKKKLKALLNTIHPDITISMFCNEAGFLPRIKDGSAKVAEVHFSRFKRLQYGRTGLWGVIDRLRSDWDERTARRYDRFITLTEEDKGYWGNMPNIQVIPNSVSYYPETPSDLTSKCVIAVGRYSYQKGLERLIESWGLIAASFPDWQLKLIGDGEKRSELQSLILRLGLSDSVLLTGNIREMDNVYHNASILALTSRYEGLPMVLLESKAFGIPSVSFSCKCGPKDVIEDGKDGILVPEGNVQEFARALAKLMSDNALLQEMGRNALSSSKKWDFNTIMPQWLELFENILSSRR